MTSQHVDTADLRRSAFESACRSFWLSYLMVEKGQPLDRDGTSTERNVRISRPDDNSRPSLMFWYAEG